MALALVPLACSPSTTSTTPVAPANPIVLALPGGATSVALSATAPTSSFTVSEPGYSGTFSGTSSNTAVATISGGAATAANARVALADTSDTFTVTATGPGTATISISDQIGHTGTFGVTVSGSASSPTPTPTPGASSAPTPVPTSTPTLTPTAPPTLTPTPPPPGVFSVNPSTVGVSGIGSANAQTILVQETGDSGTFSQTSTCASVATITPVSSAGPTVSFTVTGIAAGTCSATFSDTHGQTGGVTIVVTTAGFGIQSRERHS